MEVTKGRGRKKRWDELPLPSTLIAPSLLSADFGNLAEEIARVERAGADWLHLDIMDGHFVPNISFGPMIVGFVNRLSDLYLDVHLMIDNPAQYLEKFKQAGADCLTVHAEVSGVIPDTLQKIRDLGMDVGISLNPETSVEVLEPVYDLVDVILVMSVHPGFGGQKFIPQVLDKVRIIARHLESQKGAALIEIDGGVNPENAGEIRRCGVRILVAGNSIFASADPAQALKAIRNAADQALGSRGQLC